jgi:hypothetical protein
LVSGLEKEDTSYAVADLLTTVPASFSAGALARDCETTQMTKQTTPIANNFRVLTLKARNNHRPVLSWKSLPQISVSET